jgi:hypothetical protein
MKTHKLTIELRNVVVNRIGKMKRRHLRRTLRHARKGRNFILVCDGTTTLFTADDLVRIKVETVS